MESDKEHPFPFQIMSSCPRLLTDEEKTKLEKDKNVISEFKQNKYELEAQKNWDLFYKRNTTKFFKDRHWTKREFNELFYDGDKEVMYKVKVDYTIILPQMSSLCNLR